MILYKKIYRKEKDRNLPYQSLISILTKNVIIITYFSENFKLVNQKKYNSFINELPIHKLTCSCVMLVYTYFSY